MKIQIDDLILEKQFDRDYIEISFQEGYAEPKTSVDLKELRAAIQAFTYLDELEAIK
jgi:hypothetical protein